jgi:phosphoribosyl 1,2-cyclic phosphate phosphodiesterase
LSASIETAQKLQPKRTYFTHMCHDVPHASTEAALPPGILLAYDGLEIEVENAGALTV